MAKQCNACTAQSVVCSSGSCDGTWRARASGWTTVWSRKWYCPTCTCYFGRFNQNVIDDAKKWMCPACLEAIESQPTQTVDFSAAASSTSQLPARFSAATSTTSHGRVPVVSRRTDDWFCPRCNDLQFAKNTFCRRCTALRPGLRTDDQPRTSRGNLGIRPSLPKSTQWSPFEGTWCDGNGRVLCFIKGDTLRWCGNFLGTQVLRGDGHFIEMMSQSEKSVSAYINTHGQLQWSDGDVFFRPGEKPPSPLKMGPQPGFPPPAFSSESGCIRTSSSLGEALPPPL